jgi:tripartite-type tricarboxylate transporter receptor subunit TctC
MRRRHLLAAPLCLGAAWSPRPAQAQPGFPSRPLRLVIPVAVAGATDIVGRILAEFMAPRLGQPIIAENLAGAGSTLGAAAFHRLPADGHALFLGTNNHALMRLVYKQFPHDPEADFIPLALVSRQPVVLAVHPGLPVRTVPELLDWLRARGEAANFGAAFPGANNYMAGELLRQRAGLRFTMVPYRSAPASAQDVAAGRLDLTIDSPTLLLPLMQAGLVRGLAVSSAEPFALVPGLPGLQQAGVPDYDMTVWTMLFAKPGTPPEAVAALRAAAAAALADPLLRQRLAAAGFETWPEAGPAAAAALLRREIARWTPIVGAMNLTPG